MSNKGEKKVYIGCHSAFWGDSFRAAPQLLMQAEKLDYLVSDYLAEVTMGILAKKQARGNPGYVSEFASRMFKPLHKLIVDRGVVVITNAGGLDPLGLKRDIENLCAELGVQLKVAAVTGDNVLDVPSHQLMPFTLDGETEDLPDISDADTLSANAYFGALPILKALQSGAQVIVTGRCADSAVVLAPLMHEFGWRADQYDLLAAGSLAGHIIECGAQCCGGNSTDWQESLPWINVGFPVIECVADGSFVVTKPPNTGGVVTRGTVAEQMLYEIGDPSTYILPDVIVDFRQVQIVEEESADMYAHSNRVRVSGALGRQPTPFYKVSITRKAGYGISATLVIAGVDAYSKAIAVGESIIGNARANFQQMGIADFDDYNIEVLGSESTYGPQSRALDAREVVLRISVRHPEKRGLFFFGSEVAPSATSMAPGITGGGAGRPRPTSSLSFHSALIAKDSVCPSVVVSTRGAPLRVPHYPIPRNTAVLVSIPVTPPYTASAGERTVQVPLISIAIGRSGDKGDSANIGVIAREPRFYPLLLQQVTTERVKSYMGHLVRGHVSRFTLPGVCALNFLLTQSLGGGGLESLSIDRQGKTYAQQLLTMPVTIPVSFNVTNARAKL